MNTSKDKKKGSNWLGWLIFFLFVVGPNIIRPVSQFISQTTGGTVTIGSSIIPFIVGGLAVFIVLSSVVRAAIKLSKRSEMPMPVALPPSPSSSFLSSFPRRGVFPSQWQSKYTSTSQKKNNVFHSAFDDDEDDENDENEDDENKQPFPFPSSKTNVSSIAPSRWKIQTAPPKFEPIISGTAVVLSFLGALVIGGGLFLGSVVRSFFP
jgi:hypothetical protein